MTPAEDSPEPLLRVVRGDPRADELAALVAAVLAVQSGASTSGAADRPSSWAAYWRGVRQPVARGPDGWRSSGRPR